ncbi:MAG: zinc-ribbon domain-containing protein [Chloroflexia bacterium]
MPVCPQCGTRNPPENTTCRSCGALLEVPPVPSPPAAPEEAAPSPTAPEELPIGRAAAWGLVAAAVLGGIWFALEVLTHQPLPFLAVLVGWLVAEVVVRGAGNRRSRALQWLALGLTLLAVAGTLLALAATDPAGFSTGLSSRLQDVFSILLYLLGLFLAYASPAPRPAPRPQPQEPEAEKEAEEGEQPAEEGEAPAEAEPALRCIRCQSPTTEGEALMLPARRGQVAALCPRCVAEIEARFAAESENIQVGPAVLYGLGAALAGGVLWYLAERFSGMALPFLAFIFGWLIAEAVRRGAGRKRGRVLQWISLGLTLAMIVGTQVAAAATVQPARDARPTWSPDGMRLAFQSDRSGNWEIYVLQVETGEGNRLTNNADADVAPAWSPDGRHLAFQSDRGGQGWNLYTMNAADGTEVARLAEVLSEGEEPAWSPDGKRLALVSRSDGNPEIYVVNADGSGLLRLTENAVGDEHPTWSPDGMRLAFASERDGNWEIYTMNADGTGVSRLTDHPAADRFPAWSPDGEGIAFVSERDGNAEIYRMDPEGDHLLRLTQDAAEDGDPAWSPDGKRLAFRSERDGDAEIYQMEADGSQVTPLTRDPAGVMEVLLGRLQDPFTLILFLLALFQAYSTPAPRRLPVRKPEQPSS